MKVIEYGTKNKEVIMLLHGGGLSWWNYKDLVKLLENDYHIILPILDGHSNSDKRFTTIRDNALEIIDYIKEKYHGHIKLIGGLSLGAQILLEMLYMKEDICDYSIIESALVYPMKLTNKLVGPSINLSYSLISKKWFSHLQFKSLKINNSLFNDYYEDSKNIKKEDMISFMKENSNYELKDLSKSKSKSLIIVGSKERKIMIKSAKRINESLKNSTLKIMDGYYHGDLSLNHPYEYAKIIKELIA